PLVAPPKSVPGPIDSHLYEDVQTVGSYVILSEWETQDAFTAFLRSDAFKQVTAWGKAEILRGRPRHRIYTDSHMGTASACGGFLLEPGVTHGSRLSLDVHDVRVLVVERLARELVGFRAVV